MREERMADTAKLLGSADPTRISTDDLSRSDTASAADSPIAAENESTAPLKGDVTAGRSSSASVSEVRLFPGQSLDQVGGRSEVVAADEQLVPSTLSPLVRSQGIATALDAIRKGAVTTTDVSPSLTAEQLNEFRTAAQKVCGQDELVDEASAALGTAHRIRMRNYNVDLVYDRLKFIFDCLMTDPPQMILARDERLRLQYDLYEHAGWLSRTLARISAGSSAALVIAALVTSLVIWTVLVVFIRFLLQFDWSITTKIFFMEGQALVAISSAAFIGGVVSIATRLREFSRVRDLDPWAMFWTAMLKPLIGIVLSLFLLATLAGDIISFGFMHGNPLGIGTDGLIPNNYQITHKSLYVLWVLGFLAGFSERFAWDFVDRAKGVAEGGAGASKKTG
jgi:hypothetical protein